MSMTADSMHDPSQRGFTFSPTQLQRLGELDDRLDIVETFDDAASRNAAFQHRERIAVADNRTALRAFTHEAREPSLCRLERILAARLRWEGFAQVATPAIITADQLRKMSIDRENPLHEQVFWIDATHCLRPMLAPGLYTVSRKLMASLGLPLRVFEVGSCFRRESDGRTHLEEFTMLNLVEWGTPLDGREERLKELMQAVLDATGLFDWHVENEESAVYGEGLDAVDGDGLELASSSMGPHRLDAAWGVDCSWVGVGFGLERLLESREHRANIHRFARSITYLDGSALNIK